MSVHEDTVIAISLSQQGKHKGLYETTIDKIDEDLAKLRWSVDIQRNTQYAYRYLMIEGVKCYRHLHRMIIERMIGRSLERNEVVDHIDGNGLNNTRSNLRVATWLQNARNKRKTSRSTTGYKGVWYEKNTGRYRAEIYMYKRKINLGAYETAELAHKAYCEAAEELYGEYANFG